MLKKSKPFSCSSEFSSTNLTKKKHKKIMKSLNNDKPGSLADTFSRVGNYFSLNMVLTFNKFKVLGRNYKKGILQVVVYTLKKKHMTLRSALETTFLSTMYSKFQMMVFFPALQKETRNKRILAEDYKQVPIDQ